MTLSKIPAEIVYTETTPGGRWGQAVLHKEALRLEHNAIGRRFTDGEITQEEWEKYKRSEWQPRMEAAQESEDDAYHAMYMDVINGN